MKTAAMYSTDPIRIVRHDPGASTATSTADRPVRISEAVAIGSTPENGKSQAETRTSTRGGSARVYAAERRPLNHIANAARPTNSPAAGPEAVASAATSPARTSCDVRCAVLERQASGQAKITARLARPNIRPSPNVVRPDTAFPVSATAPYSATGNGCLRRLVRTSSSASSAAETVPARTVVVRTPRAAMT